MKARTFQSLIFNQLGICWTRIYALVVVINSGIIRYFARIAFPSSNALETPAAYAAMKIKAQVGFALPACTTHLGGNI